MKHKYMYIEGREKSDSIDLSIGEKNTYEKRKKISNKFSFFSWIFLCISLSLNTGKLNNSVTGGMSLLWTNIFAAGIRFTHNIYKHDSGKSFSAQYTQVQHEFTSRAKKTGNILFVPVDHKHKR